MSDRLPWFRCFPSALLGALAGLDPDEGLVYVTALLRIYETGGPVAETARTLSRRTGLTERRAGAALGRLIEAGKLTLASDGKLDSLSTHAEIGWQNERRRDQSAAGKASAAKRQEQGVDKKNDASAEADGANGRQKDQQNQRISATGVGQPFNHLEEEEEEQTQTAPTVLSVSDARRRTFPDDAWERFYERYPHKVGKAAAQKKFDTIRKSGRVTFAEVMNGLERYIANKPANREWCNPATFLNQGRWDDEPASPPDPSGGSHADRQKPRSGQQFLTDLANGKPFGGSDDTRSDARYGQIRLFAGSRH